MKPTPLTPRIQRPQPIHLLLLLAALVAPLGSGERGTLVAADGHLSFTVTEAFSSGRRSVSCRVHLKDANGKSVKKPDFERDRLVFYRDHFVCEGAGVLPLAPGRYTYAVERGPEYRNLNGQFDIAEGEFTRLDLTLVRWIDLEKHDWYSGDTHIHRPLDQIPFHLEAEDLHVAPVLTVWNQENHWEKHRLPAKLVTAVTPTRVVHALASEDERNGGALLYFNANAPLELKGDSSEVPSPVVNLRKTTTSPDVVVEIEKPFWWDAPTWVATGRIHTIGIANNHQNRSQMYESEAWGRPRDAARLPAPRGNGFYSQELYYRFLNCGLRIAPTAGSASGVLNNPIGYNRIYVHLDEDFSYAAWWRALVAGHSFVTNGPILLVEANGSHPGKVFSAPAGQDIEVSLDVRLGGNDPIESVEVIRNGRIVERVTPDAGGWLRPRPLRFKKSGWFLVRAIADVPETFRFASSAPFYVKIDGRNHVEPEDVQFFIDWVNERIAKLETSTSKDLTTPSVRESVLTPHREALKFYEGLLEQTR
jgi:hypothetical protein